MCKPKKIRNFAAKLNDRGKNPTDLAYQILREVSTLVQVVEKMQGYAARIPCESYEAAHAYLEATNAYMDPDEARIILDK